MKKLIASLILSLLVAVVFFSVQTMPAASSSSLPSNLALITPTPQTPPTQPPATPPPVTPPQDDPGGTVVLPKTGEAVTLWSSLVDQVPLLKDMLVALTGSNQKVEGPISRIEIPSLNVDSNIVPVHYDGQSWDISALKLGVGWLDNTSEPGQGENTVLVGHLNLKLLGLGPFRTLYRIPQNAEIVLHTPDFVYTYQVREVKVVSPADESVLQPSNLPQLTLVTCADWDAKAQEYRNRLVVVADLVRVGP